MTLSTANAATPDDSRPSTSPVYCYVIRHLDADLDVYRANWPTMLEIDGLPAALGAADPQEFTPAQITHGQIERRDGLDRNTFGVEARLAQAGTLSRYTIFSQIPRIEVVVVKVAPEAARSGEIEFDRDCLIVRRGLIADISIEGLRVSLTCAQDAFLSDQQIPRWRYTKTCNHVLYGPDCGLDPTPFEFAANATQIEPQSRRILLNDQLAGSTDNYFRGGVATHQPTGIGLSVFASENIGADTRITVHNWLPDIEATDVFVLQAGCRHTARDCVDKFDNIANFGGFPFVPSRNPTLHGVTAGERTDDPLIDSLLRDLAPPA